MTFDWKTPFRAFSAAGRAWVWLFRGYRIFTTEQEQLDRKAECLNCEDYCAESEQCRICTCFIEAKTMIAAEQCPKKKWLRIRQKRNTV